MFGQPRRGTNLPLSPLPCCRFNRDTHRGRQARAASRRTFNIRDVESTSQDSNRYATEEACGASADQRPVMVAQIWRTASSCTAVLIRCVCNWRKDRAASKERVRDRAVAP